MAKKIILAGSEGLLGSSIKKHLTQEGHEILSLDLTLGHDLSDEKFVKKWFSENSADSLINTFAIDDTVKNPAQQNSLDIELKEFSKVVDVNVTTLFSVCREYIRNNKEGNIVNFSSIYGVVSPRNDMYGDREKFIAYGVSKAAVIQLTRHLSVHFAPNFLINCLVLGGVKNNQADSFVDSYSKNVPLSRMMEAAEVNHFISYLIDGSNTYGTGSSFVFDGGWTAW